MDILVADVENPAGAAATAEPDAQSQIELVCFLSCLVCTILAVSAGMVLLFCLSAHASTPVRVLAGFGLVVGIVGLAFGACFCALVAHICIHGNCEGTRQEQAPLVAA
ncbi:unnamed protein product [Alopecurus aequalis]